MNSHPLGCGSKMRVHASSYRGANSTRINFIKQILLGTFGT